MKQEVHVCQLSLASKNELLVFIILGMSLVNGLTIRNYCRSST